MLPMSDFSLAIRYDQAAPNWPENWTARDMGLVKFKYGDHNKPRLLSAAVSFRHSAFHGFVGQAPADHRNSLRP